MELNKNNTSSDSPRFLVVVVGLLLGLCSSTFDGRFLHCSLADDDYNDERSEKTLAQVISLPALLALEFNLL